MPSSLHPFATDVPNIYREESGSDAPRQENSHLSSNIRLDGNNQCFSIQSLEDSQNEPQSALPMNRKNQLHENINSVLWPSRNTPSHRLESQGLNDLENPLRGSIQRSKTKVIHREAANLPLIGSQKSNSTNRIN